MISRDRIPAVLAAALLLAVPGAARAHEYWLSPSIWRAGPGDTVAITALAGEGFAGERRRFAPPRAVAWRVRAGRELDLAPVAAAGDTVWARFAAADSGGLLFAYQSDFAPITLDAATFDRYLEAEGLYGPLAARRARMDTIPGRERYRRCAKSWLAGTDASRATAPLSWPCEIVPLATPGSDRRLRVRVLFEGAPLAGARLHAWRQPLMAGGRPPDPARRDPVAAAWSGRTDARGEAVVPVGEAGEWLIGAVHMIPSRDPAAADWESTWTSLTFAREPARIRPAAGAGHNGPRRE